MSSTFPLPVVPPPLGVGFWCDLFDLAPDTNFVDVTQDLNVNITFVTGGAWATQLKNMAPATVPFTISLFYESFGNAPEGEVIDPATGVVPAYTGDLAIGAVASATGMYVGDPNAWDYNIAMTIPANTLLPGQTYKLTAVLQSTAWAMNAFIESEMFSTMP